MANVAVLTDSTSTIPKSLVDQYEIIVIPQIVIWDEETQLDGVDIQPTAFYERLSRSPVSPTTSQATIGSFKGIYEELHAEGKDILCVLISDKLSGTIGSAVQAKDLFPEARVEIVNSSSTAMGLGFVVIEAAKAALSGEDLATCKAIAEKAATMTGVVMTPETLEYLHRGGRIGGATRFLGTALNLKPILELQGGRLEPVERVRTRKKVIRRVVELVAERIGDRKPVRLAALHANSEEDGRLLLELAAEVIAADESLLTEVSPAIGVHTGPGTIGLTYIAGM